MGELFRRLRYLWHYRRHQAELAEELDFHRAMKRRELEQEGLDAERAAAGAQRALGNDLSARQYTRDVWVAPALGEFFQDLRFAVRLLAKERSFSIVAVLVLGVGIGVNNTMFTLLSTHTLRSLPIPDAERVLYISMVDERSADLPLSHQEFLALRDASSFSSVAAYTSAPVTVGDEGRAPDRWEGAYITANAMDAIGVQPTLGRSFSVDEDVPGTATVAILGHDAWQRRHDGDAQVLGKTILVSGIPARVVGIMPRRSGFPMTTDVWLPLSHLPERAEQSRDNRTLRVVGRVRDGIAASDAAREVDAIIDRVEASTAIPGAKVRARVVPINERFLGRVTNPAWLAFLAASLIVVLVSAANVANLMIARSALRRGEIAIRTSLGASRLRIVRQVLTESLVLAGAAAVVGLAVSRLGVYAFRSAIPENTLPYWIDYAVDARVLTALILVAALTVIVFGLLPAFQASKVDVNRVLISGGQSIIRARTRLSTAVFLVAEIALTVVLLANAVQAVRSRAPEVQSDKVLGTRDVLTASLTLPAARYGTPEQLTDFQLRAAERLREIPGVSHVSFASVLPSRIAPAHRLDVENVDRSADASAPTVPVVAIAPDYFASLGLSMRRGREFLLADGESGREYAIVNERFVDVHFQGGEPLGRRISLTGGSSPGSQWRWFTIIGVAPDVRQSPARRAEPVAYIPIRASASASLTLVVRSSIDPEALTPRLREELHALDPNLPLYRAMTLGRSIAEAQWNSRVSARLIVSITLIAVVLSLVGLYAVTSHAVSQRMRELSVRLALGARPAQIRWLIIRHALLHASVGLAVGSLGTIAWNAAFVSERVDLTIASPANLAVVAASLAGIVLLACLAPARRAARLDPALVLRRP